MFNHALRLRLDAQGSSGKKGESAAGSGSATPDVEEGRNKKVSELHERSEGPSASSSPAPSSAPSPAPTPPYSAGAAAAPNAFTSRQ